ncbi:MAG: hypothetical protein WCY93_06380 [Anaerolineaceae bacterium]
MKSTREKILRILKSFPDSQINDLAKAVEINTISVRHHLASNGDACNLTNLSCPNYHIAYDHPVICTIA